MGFWAALDPASETQTDSMRKFVDGLGPEATPGDPAKEVRLETFRNGLFRNDERVCGVVRLVQPLACPHHSTIFFHTRFLPFFACSGQWRPPRRPREGGKIGNLQERAVPE